MVERQVFSAQETAIHADACLRDPDLFRPETKRPSWLPREISRQSRFYYRGPGCRIVPLSEPGLWLPLSCAIALVNSAVAQNGSSNPSSAVDMTGATLLVGCVASSGVSSSLTDSASNTYSGLTVFVCQFGGVAQFRYAANPTTSSTQTFTVGSAFASGVIAGFSGVTLTSPFDDETTADTQGSPSSPPALTPGFNDCLIVVGANGPSEVGEFTVSGGFTRVGFNPGAPSAAWASVLGYVVQTTAASATPVVTATNGGYTDGVGQASFKPAAGATVTWPGYQSPYGWH